MRWAGPNANIAIAICASTILSGCTSPLGRVRHQKPDDLVRRLESNKDKTIQKEPTINNKLNFKTDILTGKQIYETPPIEKLAGHILKEYVTRAYNEEEWPYQLWQFGNEVSDWVDERLQFDFYGFKGHVTARTNEIGITFSTEF